MLLVALRFALFVCSNAIRQAGDDARHMGAALPCLEAGSPASPHAAKFTKRTSIMLHGGGRCIRQAQAFFQQTWIIVVFALLFVALSLAMFGLYELQMPSGLQTRFADASNRIRGGKFISTAIMGALSSLVVTACVAPPLVAALAVIGQAGDVVRGRSGRCRP